MKKQRLPLTVVLLGLCVLIFACRKEFKGFMSNSNAPSTTMVDVANDWLSLQTKSSTEKKKLIPRWSKARTIKDKEGKTVLVVPTREKKISNTHISVRRYFQFHMDGNKVKWGEITELVGNDYNVSEHADELLKSAGKQQISNFNGSIIRYDVNYNRLLSLDYKNGAKTAGESLIMQGKDSKLFVNALNSRKRATNGLATNGLKVHDDWDDYDWEVTCVYLIILDEDDNIISVTLLFCIEETIDEDYTPEEGSGSGSGSGSESMEPAGGNYTPPYGGGVTGGPGGGIYNPNNPVAQISVPLYIHDGTLTSSCIKNLTTELGLSTSNMYKFYVGTFASGLGATSTVDITYTQRLFNQPGDDPNRNAYASQTGTGNTFAVQLNSTVMASASQEYILTTAVHQPQWAFLTYRPNVKGYMENNLNYTLLWYGNDLAVTETKFPGLIANGSHDAQCLVLGAVREYFGQYSSVYTFLTGVHGISDTDVVTTYAAYRAGTSGTVCP